MNKSNELLFNSRAREMCFDNDFIYTSAAKDIFKWDINTKTLVSIKTIPPNDSMNKGVLLCLDENNIYFNSTYFFHVMDKKTNEILHQRQFGTNNSSDFDLGRILVDNNQVYFPMRNNGVVVVDKNNYDNFEYVKKDDGSIWALEQDENMIYMGGVEKTIFSINKSTLKTEAAFKGHKGNVHNIYSYKGYIVSTSADNSIIIWNKSDGAIFHQLKNTDCSMGRAVMNENYLLCVAKKRIKVWDINTWNLVANVKTFGRLFYSDDIIYIADRDVARIEAHKIDDIISIGEK